MEGKAKALAFPIQTLISQLNSSMSDGPSKKRAAGRELSRDNPDLEDEDENLEFVSGTFKKASEEILASRRILKVRRSKTTSAPFSNPFAGICLVPPTEPHVPTTSLPAQVAQVTTEAPDASEETVSDDPTETNVAINETEKIEGENDQSIQTVNEKAGDDKPVAETAAEEKDANDKNNNVSIDATKYEGEDKQDVDGEKVEDGEKDDANEKKDSNADASPLSSFGQLSSNQNAFMGFAGTGFSTSTFSFGLATKDGSEAGASSGSLFGLKKEQTSFPSLAFGLSTNGNSSLFGASGASVSAMSVASVVPSMQEVTVETGEENEKAVFTADSVLFEFDGGWKERGKGELKVNLSTTGTGKARLVMRARGNYRLILNASIYPDMKLTNMEKKGITFACMNSASEGKEGLSTFALKFKDASIADEFRAAVTAHKEKIMSTGLKTPENSPKASDE